MSVSGGAATQLVALTLLTLQAVTVADADVFHPIERATSTNVYVLIFAPSLALGFAFSALVRRALAPDER